MDLDKLKQLAITHFEKVIFGAICLAAGYLVFAGSQKPLFTRKRDPGELRESANQVKLEIDGDHNTEVIKDRRPTDSIFDATVELYKPVDSSLYSLSNPWVVKDSQAVVRRRDPVLSPIESLRTTSVICSLAYNGARTPTDYPLAQQEDALPFEDPEEERRPSPRNRRRRGGEDDLTGDLTDSADFGGFADDSLSETPQERIFDSELDRGFNSLSAKEPRNNPQPKQGWFIAGTALLPHSAIYKDFLVAYQETEDFSVTRDTPAYFDFQVQRAEVTNKSVDQLTPDDWTLAWERANYIELAASIWNGFAAEFVPDDYRDEFLTMWIPPVLIEDYHEFSTHPAIPKLSAAELEEIERIRQAEESETDFSFDLGQRKVSDPTASNQRADFQGNANGQFESQVDENPVSHKLIRFYDFVDIAPPGTPRIRPGAVYVYRVRYAVIDPNFPVDPQNQPRISSLDIEAAKRVQPKVAAAIDTGERDFRLWSDWSEPSPPVSLGSIHRNYFGPVNTGALLQYQVGGRPVEIRRETPTVEVALTEVNDVLGATLQATLKAEEGTMLTYNGDRVEAIDPITQKIKRIRDYAVDSNAAVIDIDGGSPLVNGQELKEPTTVLTIDRNGKLVVGDSVKEELPYRLNSYADERGIDAQEATE